MKEKPLHSDDKLSGRGETASLVLYNDDVNTFDHVIRALVEICGHDPVQAEQCATLVHHKGSCEVKCGMPEILAKMSRSLNSEGLKSRVLPKN
jgi:ATP-dependent Clp protease adaptor protein ClpS